MHMMSTPGVPPGRLAADGTLESDLWIDRPDALDQVEARRKRGELTDEQAAKIADFVRDGYCVFKPSISDDLIAELLADVDTAWKELPPDAAFGLRHLLTRFSSEADRENRLPGCRLGDFHGYSPAALALYLHPEIHRYAELILDEPVVAKQSIFFEWGSGQALHRDPIHVRVYPASHLVAAWIALEDISPDCGPLVYVAGSHRVRYHEFEPGRYYADISKDTPETIRAAEAEDLERCRAAGLSPRPFLAKKGEVLLWHHSLLHGGSIPNRHGITRKSFVVHLSSRANTSHVGSTYTDPYLPRAADGRAVDVAYWSHRVVSVDGCHGFESPLADRMRDETVERARFEAGAIERGASPPTVAASEAAALRAKIAAMEASRFWKIRNSWFAVKRGLGLTDES